MLDFLSWYFPWTRVDAVLKAELLIWFASLFFGVWIYVRTILLNRPWLPLRGPAGRARRPPRGPA